jgi:hypothetical protein
MLPGPHRAEIVVTTRMVSSQRIGGDDHDKIVLIDLRIRYLLTG